VSLAPSITETLFSLGLGDCVVGRTEFCDWPEACKEIKIIGSFNAIVKDDVLGVNPDLVLGTTLHKQLINDLKSDSFSAKIIPPQPVYEAPSSIELIGNFAGVPRAGKLLAEKVASEIAIVKRNAAHFSPITICYLCNINCPVWYTCTIAACIEFMNCRLAGRNRSSSNENINIIEAIVSDKPQRIIVPRCSKCKETCVDPLVKGDSKLKVFIEGNDVPVITLTSKLLARPGPRAAQALCDLGIAIFDKF
jgi:iron complex transport system substrate-binding protein